MESQLSGLVLILTIGVGAQWVAWRLRIPAIVLLLGAGTFVGPVTGWIDPDRLFGDLLLPGVSLAVAVILFEGGLSLRFRELRGAGAAVWRLCTIGALTTWALAFLGAERLLGMPPSLAAVFGAILIVTGPTVILPMLRQLRLSQPASSILKWEGILIDPLGAILAVVTFETVTIGVDPERLSPLLTLLFSLGAGTACGLVAAVLLTWLLSRYYIPDHLQSPFVLAVVAGVLLAANALAPESGILAATVMGIALAAQRRTPTREILEFKENLRVLLISSLFVVLAARLDLGDLRAVALPGAAYVAWLVLVVRPACVLVSTLGSSVPWSHRIVLMVVAPRGIVAAAVASLFALQLAQVDAIDGSTLIPLTFLVIVGTIVVYAVLAPVVARALEVSSRNPQGVLLVGAQSWSRALGAALHECGVKVLIVDDHIAAIRRVRMAGLPGEAVNVLSEHLGDQVDLDGIGHALMLTPNDHANALAAVHLAEVFGRANVYQLPTDTGDVVRSDQNVPRHLRGRRLFRKDATYSVISRMVSEGAQIRRTSITKEFGLEAYRERYGDDALPLVVHDARGNTRIVTAGEAATAEAGDTLIGLVSAKDV